MKQSVAKKETALASQARRSEAWLPRHLASLTLRPPLLSS